jgi:hypothetical protein
LTVKSSLVDPCDKHQGYTIIFENSKDLTKYCEKCFIELAEKALTSQSHEEEEESDEEEEHKTS